MEDPPTFRRQLDLHPPAADASEFLDQLKPRLRRRGDFIYRGVGNVAHALVPSALRDRTDIWEPLFGPASSARSMASDLDTLVKFVVACDRSGFQVPGDGSRLRDTLKKAYWEKAGWPRHWPPDEHRQVWAVAQHHGLPTRLLDWTRNPIVAAYFAAVSCLRTARSQSQELAVWALDREGESKVWGSRLTVVEIPAAHSPNLAAQAGLFTMSLVDQQLDPSQPFPDFPPLEKMIQGCVPQPVLTGLLRGIGHLLTIDVLLTKFTLQARHARDLLSLCRQYGVSGATMFPGYDGAAKEVEEQSYKGPLDDAHLDAFERKFGD